MPGASTLSSGRSLMRSRKEVQQLVFLMEVAGFHIEDHLVDAAGVDDLDLPTLDILEAGHDLFHLMGVDEHALDAGGGVHAAHDAAEARAGTPAGAGGAIDVGQVAVARRMSGYVLLNEVTTISPTSPSFNGMPVSGWQIST